MQFGPNKTGKFYISIFYHRGTNRLVFKNKWHPDISPFTEYEIFCFADDGNWFDARGHYWGVRERGEAILGCSGERLCKFPKTSNVIDPWHGFPVSPMEDGDDYRPSDDIVEAWIATGIVSKTFGRRIQRRKV